MIWKWAKVLCLVILCGAIFAAAQDSPESVVLATVNDDSILAEHLESELMRIHSGQSETSRGHFDVEKVLDKLVNDRLLIQDARLMQLDQEPDFLKELDRHRKARALEEYLKEAIPDTFPMGESEIRDYYSRQFRQVHLYLLTLRDRPQADSAAARLHTVSHLAEIASAYPVEVYRYGGGDQGLKPWGQLESALREPVRSLSVGQIAGPIQISNGYSFVQLLGEQPADSAQLEQHRARLKAALNQQKKRSFREDLIQNLRAQYGLVIYEDLYQQFLSTLDSTSQDTGFQNQPIAQVGQSTVSIKALRRKLAHNAGMNNPQIMRGLARDALDNLIEDRLFEQEAAAQGYLQSPRVSKSVEAFGDSLLLYGYLEQVVVPQIAISPMAADSFYRINAEKFRRPDDIRLSQITVGTADSARQMLNRLREGADFGWLVKECSIDEYASKGGERGWSNLGSFPPAMKADLDTARIGQFVGPYSEEGGYLVYRLQDRRPGKVPDLAEVKGSIHQQLYEIEFRRVLDGILNKLKANSVIVINHEVLNSMIIGGTKE